MRSREIDQLEQDMGMPGSIHGQYSGTLQAFQIRYRRNHF